MELNWNSIILVNKLKEQSMDLYEYVYKSCINTAIIREKIKNVCGKTILYQSPAIGTLLR